MRRLSEILAFPKAWYRRTLVRRLFLGEFKTTEFHSAETAPAAQIGGGIDGAAASNGLRKAALAPGAVNGGKQGRQNSNSFHSYTGLNDNSCSRVM